MKRPRRTVRRESEVTVRDRGKHRALVLIIPPTCDVLLIRAKGTRTAHELDILSAWSVANKLTAAKRREARKGRK